MTTLRVKIWNFAALVVVLIDLSGAARAVASDIEFNRDIRPILSENCFYCHGQDANKRQADLRLDVRDAAIEAGAIVPGDIDASEFIERINAEDPDVMMPPPDRIGC